MTDAVELVFHLKTLLFRSVLLSTDIFFFSGNIIFVFLFNEQLSCLPFQRTTLLFTFLTSDSLCLSFLHLEFAHPFLFSLLFFLFVLKFLYFLFSVSVGASLSINNFYCFLNILTMKSKELDFSSELNILSHSPPVLFHMRMFVFWERASI